MPGGARQITLGHQVEFGEVHKEYQRCQAESLDKLREATVELDSEL